MQIIYFVFCITSTIIIFIIIFIIIIVSTSEFLVVERVGTGRRMCTKKVIVRR